MEERGIHIKTILIKSHPVTRHGRTHKNESRELRFQGDRFAPEEGLGFLVGIAAAPSVSYETLLLIIPEILVELWPLLPVRPE